MRRRIGHGILLGVMAMLRSHFLLCCRVLPDLATGQAERLFCTPRRIKSKPFEGLPPPQEVMLDTAHGRLCCYRWVDPELPRQQKILLVHGWSGSPQQFQHLARRLLQSGCEIATYDQPAHGSSEGRRVSLPDFIDALDQVLARFGPFDSVLGHSLGGAAVAYRLSRDGKGIGRAILAAAPADIESVTQRFAKSLWITEPVRRRMQHRIEERYGQMMSRFSADVYAARISTPVLVAHDQYDEEVPFDDAKRLHKEIANSSLLALDAEGHHRMLKHPTFIESVAQFVTT